MVAFGADGTEYPIAVRLRASRRPGRQPAPAGVDGASPNSATCAANWPRCASGRASRAGGISRPRPAVEALQTAWSTWSSGSRGSTRGWPRLTVPAPAPAATAVDPWQAGALRAARRLSAGALRWPAAALAGLSGMAAAPNPGPGPRPTRCCGAAIEDTLRVAAGWFALMLGLGLVGVLLGFAVHPQQDQPLHLCCR